MKNFKILGLILTLSLSSTLFAMEQGIEEAKKQRTVEPSQTVSKLLQNIWTLMSEFLIDRNGETEAKIFRITDMMMYPKKLETLSNNKNIDKEKVAKQLALAKALDNYIKTVGRDKAIKNYEDFKTHIMKQVVKSRVEKAKLLSQNSVKTTRDLALEIAFKLLEIDMILNVWGRNYALSTIEDKINFLVTSLDDRPNYVIRIKKLLEYTGINPDEFKYYHDSTSIHTLLYDLVFFTDAEYLGYVYSRFKFKDKTGKETQDYFHKDRINNRVKMIRLLIQYGANPNFTISSGSTIITLLKDELKRRLIAREKNNIPSMPKQSWFQWVSGRQLEPDVDIQKIEVIKQIIDMLERATEIRQEFLDKQSGKVSGPEGKQEIKNKTSFGPYYGDL